MSCWFGCTAWMTPPFTTWPEFCLVDDWNSFSVICSAAPAARWTELSEPKLWFGFFSGRRVVQTPLVPSCDLSSAARVVSEPHEPRSRSINLKCIQSQGAVYGSESGKSNLKTNLKSNGQLRVGFQTLQECDHASLSR